MCGKTSVVVPNPRTKTEKVIVPVFLLHLQIILILKRIETF